MTPTVYPGHHILKLIKYLPCTVLYGRPYRTVRGVVGNVSTASGVGDVSLGAAGIVVGVVEAVIDLQFLE